MTTPPPNAVSRLSNAWCCGRRCDARRPVRATAVWSLDARCRMADRCRAPRLPPAPLCGGIGTGDSIGWESAGRVQQAKGGRPVIAARLGGIEAGLSGSIPRHPKGAIGNPVDINFAILPNSYRTDTNNSSPLASVSQAVTTCMIHIVRERNSLSNFSDSTTTV